MTAVVLLWSALLCFDGFCHPALVGKETPIGIFHVKLEKTMQPGYDGNVLVFDETKTRAYAIHRVWLLIPSEHRQERLQSGIVSQRRNVTMGCINVEPNVYNKLILDKVKWVIILP